MVDDRYGRVAYRLIVDPTTTERPTAWAAAESILGIKYLSFRGGGIRPNVQFKSELILRSRGMGAVTLGASAGANLSWSFGNWGLPMNVKYAAGSENDKQLGGSEMDRWRVAAGVAFVFSSLDWNWVLTVVGAKPFRTKPNEWSLEISNRFLSSKHWSLNVGGAGGLRQKGID